MVKKNICVVCDASLEALEGGMCSSCVSFFEWKYGSLETFMHVRHKALMKKIGGDLK